MKALAAPVFALVAVLVLPHCGRRSDASSTGDVPAADTSALDAMAPPTRTGAACRGDGDCAGLLCLTTLQRDCAGPVRPHTWRIEFAGGYCHPPVDLPRGDIPGGCPAGTGTLTAFVGCDGIPFRFCVTACRGDADCRAAEGYRCNTESGRCHPAQFVGESPDAGDAPDGG